MIKFNIMTLFPDMINNMLSESIIGRARSKGLIDIKCYQIRDYTTEKHKKVDDYPYGGGNGMIMMADPIARCFENICSEYNEKPLFIYMSPVGKKFDQKVALDLSFYSNIAILCGHYEGVDERVLDMFADERISIGDYVLTGGELPALVLVDTVCRMIPGVLSEAECFKQESYYNNILEYPQYTRPSIWRNIAVPSVLLSGNHMEIQRWKDNESVKQTKKYRPDLII